MKKLLSIGVAALLATTTFAFDFPTNGISQLSAAVYPTYTPGLLNDKGDKAEWGGGLCLLYPVGTPYLLAGAGVEYYANRFVAPNVSVTLQYPIKLGEKFSITPFAVARTFFPINSGEDHNAVDESVGAGAYATVWRPFAGGSVQLF